ncbi:hypothetical protein LWI28_029257 [Acer negundo]|uniref:holo-[acyl-carrier-protein] synthase n=1 Tax=Acer negundo TaxID=4023 RepID=A0AAD5I801_ACENE|nr:hypothetical protein LWI28_029257 [Acer negundo]
MNMVMNVRCFQRNFSSALPPLVSLQLPSKLETHFWYILPDEVTSSSLLNQHMELLSPSEKLNVNQMRGDNRKAALLARALVDWPNDDNQCPPPLHFNISHTSSLVACGVTVDVPVGIDVEEKQRRIKNNILAFAKRYFSPEEVKILSAISDPDLQHQEFIKLWTLKEAYVKALGINASEIVVESDYPENLTSNWEFALLDLACSHYAAICVEKDKSIGGEASIPMRLTAWKTIPSLKMSVLLEQMQFEPLVA